VKVYAFTFTTLHMARWFPFRVLFFRESARVLWSGGRLSLYKKKAVLATETSSNTTSSTSSSSSSYIICFVLVLVPVVIVVAP